MSKKLALKRAGASAARSKRRSGSHAPKTTAAARKPAAGVKAAARKSSAAPRKLAIAAKPRAARAAPKPAPKHAAKHAAKLAHAAGAAQASKQTPVLQLVPPAPASVARPGPVRVFQIFYDAQQRPLLDPAFEPYDNRGDAHPLLEFNVFRKIARTQEAAAASLWGALSWKFQQKVGMSGIELLRLIEAQPGFDVYYCNPHPDTESLYPNLWMQGETSHPNFLLLCNEFFQAAGLPLQVLAEIQPSNAFASANYFVATPKFWQGYLAFVEGAIARAEDKLSQTARKMLYSDASDARAMHARASYMPHIVERLFSLYLATEGAGFKAYKYPANAQVGAQAHLRLLREMKDVAHRTRSVWLAACWLNYRNLYLANVHDRAWLQKYLKTVTPTQVKFSSFPAAMMPKEIA